MSAKLLMIALIISSIFSSNLHAQYFGKNKPHYEKIDFEVHESPNFSIYEYLGNDKLLEDLTFWSELWYLNHQNILQDTIKQKNPILFYNDHADFQQTNAISGSIGVGTGGVTEAFKNRVIMPLAMSNAQTNHVLGHELVHAWQYNMILNGDSTSLQSLGNLPLWMVEGLAEYLSIGSVDAHTAMWMRDAVLNDDIPEIKDLSNPKYFPYRYGHAFWAFLTGLKGDTIIAPFFENVAKYGFEKGSIETLGMGQKNLSALWIESLKHQFGPYLKGGKENPIGKELVNKKNGGELNVSPALSPNGRYVVFLSEKDLFSTDLFVADALSGKILNKLASTLKDGHIDDYNYFESAGTWSPNSKEFAFVGVAKGRNILIIKEALTGKTIKEIAIKGLPAFSNPAWSPDGKTIILSGMINGQTDLFAYELKSNKLTRLTNDSYSEIQAAWSPDGKKLVFASDRLSMGSKSAYGPWTFNIAKMEWPSKIVKHFDFFMGANNLNPVIDTSGNILFLSNQDGYRNIYKFNPERGDVFQMTDLITGVSGITPYSPGITIARKRNRLIYTHYFNNKYILYRTKTEDMPNIPISSKEVRMGAAQLPRIDTTLVSLVDQQINNLSSETTRQAVAINDVPYKPNFKLDYVGGGAGVGVGTSQAFGTTTGAVGGIDLLFSDILGNNKLFTSLRLNGEIADFGGVVAYINNKQKVNWGASLSHIPYRSTYGGFLGFKDLKLEGGGYIQTAQYQYIINRLFEDKVGIFGQYPFSRTLRVEASSSFSRYSNKVIQLDHYYDAFNQLVMQEKTKLEGSPGFNLWTAGTALVGDNSYFGLTAPLKGHRFRIGVDQYMGEFQFTAPTLDFRVYRFYKPIGLAFKVYHYGRYGGNSEQLYPLYVGNPWYVRGYNSNKAIDLFINNDKNFNQLIGTKLLISNFEVRIPFTGPERLALIKSKIFFTDLNLFVDGGMAWTDFSQFKSTNDSKYLDAIPVFSAGVSLRINLFGAMILEPYYAYPLLKESKGSFGINFIPGW
jgi:WD40 repeat protein